MKYWRHPPLAAWTAIVVLLAVVVVGALQGHAHKVAPGPATSPRVVVTQLTANMSRGDALVATGGALGPWAKSEAALARAGMRVSHGALREAFFKVVLAARSAESASSDAHSSMHALVNVGAAVDGVIAAFAA